MWPCPPTGVDPSSMTHTACCQMDPLARTWINKAEEAGTTQPFCPDYLQMAVDRFTSYCDYHPPYRDEVVNGLGMEPRQSFFNCRQAYWAGAAVKAAEGFLGERQGASQP
eukprot:166743-Chlamydomonas_euryale.AAC.1